MLTPDERAIGPALWVLCGIFAVIIAACLWWGRLPFSYYEVVRRDENPKAFWFGIGTWGLMFVAAAWGALYFSLPEPGPW